MKIVKLGISRDKELIYNNLPYFLSQELFVTLSKKVQDAKKVYFDKKNQLVNLQSDLKNKKDNYSNSFKNRSKQRTISRIIESINTLRKEGVIVGHNKKKIQTILGNLMNANSLSLKSLEEDLNRYANDK